MVPHCDPQIRSSTTKMDLSNGGTPKIVYFDVTFKVFGAHFKVSGSHIFLQSWQERCSGWADDLYDMIQP